MPALIRECRRCTEEFTAPNTGVVYCSVWCRFMSKVRKDDECWTWTGGLGRTGYGRIQIDKKYVQAHRWSYEHLGRGTLDPRLVIDHLCRNIVCVNPRHLEQVPQRENLKRGKSPSWVTHVTGICQRGHSMEDAWVSPSTGRRTCATCLKERQAAR
jgi:hypothetical protein